MRRLARMLSEQARRCSRLRPQARAALAAAEAPFSFAVRNATAAAERRARNAAAAEKGAPAAPTFQANPVPESSRQQVRQLAATSSSRRAHLKLIRGLRFSSDMPLALSQGSPRLP